MKVHIRLLLLYFFALQTLSVFSADVASRIPAISNDIFKEFGSLNDDKQSRQIHFNAIADFLENSENEQSEKEFEHNFLNASHFVSSTHTFPESAKLSGDYRNNTAKQTPRLLFLLFHSWKFHMTL